jgi:hypothetical protein
MSIMIRIFLFLLCSASTATSIGQHLLAVEWSRSYGGTYSDDGNFIHQRPDETFIIAGTTGWANGDLSSATGSGRLFIMGADAQGQMTWCRLHGDSSILQLFDGVLTEDGGYVLVGRITSPSPGVPIYDAPGHAFIWKVDATGELVWQLTYGGSGSDWAKSVELTADGGFIISGSTVSTDGNIAPMMNGPDLWILRLDANGNEIWQNAYDNNDMIVPVDVLETSDGGFIFAATRYWAIDFQQYVDMWVGRLDPSGNVEWSRYYGGSSADHAASLELLADGSYLLLGHTTSFDGDMSGNTGQGTGWAAKLDALGEPIWSVFLDAQLTRSMEDGTSHVLLGTKPQTSDPYSHTDVCMIRLDQNGQMLWQRTFGGSHSESCRFITRTNDGFVLAGRSMSSDLLLSSNMGHSDIWLLKLTKKGNILSGTLHVDEDNDQLPGPDETRIANRFVELAGTGEMALSNAIGDHGFAVADPGTYTLVPPALQYFQCDPAEHNPTITTPNSTNGGLHFSYTSDGSIQDLQVFLTPVIPFRPGFSSMYSIQCRNMGTIAVEASLSIDIDPLLMIELISLSPTITNGNQLQWDLGVLSPFEERHMLIHVGLDASVELGTILATTAEISPISADVVPADNVSFVENEVVGSFDPNDIQATPNTIDINDLDTAVIDYLIRFQNTCTDTAFTVAVEDFLPENTVIGSFEFIGASHPVELVYFDFIKKLRFQFDNILLPDSNTNEIASHGFIRYRIAPEPTLSVGDVVVNQVAIFFDFNAPVITNEAHTTITTFTALSDEHTASRPMKIYPNPTNGIFRVEYDQLGTSGTITIRDLLGRMVHDEKLTAQIQEIQMKDPTAGTYIMTITTMHGTHTARVVIQ